MKTTDCTIHANIIDLEDLRARMDALEETLGEILNTGNLDALQEFTGGMDITAEDLADFTLADYVSPELEESEAEELLALREAFEGVGTCAGNALISEDYFQDFTREEAFDIGDLDRDSYLDGFIDWKAAAECNQQDYSRVIVGGREYWVRS